MSIYLSNLDVPGSELDDMQVSAGNEEEEEEEENICYNIDGNFHNILSL